MAQAEHIPIYKCAYDLCLYVEQVVRGFSRYDKYALGRDLRESARRPVMGDDLVKSRNYIYSATPGACPLLLAPPPPVQPLQSRADRAAIELGVLLNRQRTAAQRQAPRRASTSEDRRWRIGEIL